MAFCPNCVSFRIECNPEPEDYDKLCEYYEDMYADLGEFPLRGEDDKD